MFLNTHYRSFINPFSQRKDIIQNFSQSDLFNRIKTVVAAIIAKIVEFSQEIQKKRDQLDLKTFALLACATLIVMFALSIFRRKNSNNGEGGGVVPPPTPALTNRNLPFSSSRKGSVEEEVLIGNSPFSSRRQSLISRSDTRSDTPYPNKKLDFEGENK